MVRKDDEKKEKKRFRNSILKMRCNLNNQKIPTKIQRNKYKSIGK